MKIFLLIIFYSFYLLFPLIIFFIWKLYRQKKKSIEIIFLIIISLILLWARFIEPSTLALKKYNFSVAIENSDSGENLEKNNLKVAVFSDIHAGVFTSQKTIQKIVKKINKLEADLVLIPGDFVYFSEAKNLKKYLGELEKIEAPTLAVLGNHDYGKKEKDLSRDISSALESSGVLMLDNKVKKLFINNKEIEIIGLADIWTAEPNYNILNEVSDSSDLSLILAHNPDTAYEILEKNPEASKADLMISGHTHAGQIRIPLLYKYIIPTKNSFDKGFYNISGQNVFITAGVGSSGLPMRLFNFPEISLLSIDF